MHEVIPITCSVLFNSIKRSLFKTPRAHTEQGINGTKLGGNKKRNTSAAAPKCLTVIRNYRCSLFIFINTYYTALPVLIQASQYSNAHKPKREMNNSHFSCVYCSQRVYLRLALPLSENVRHRQEYKKICRRQNVVPLLRMHGNTYLQKAKYYCSCNQLLSFRQNR